MTNIDYDILFCHHCSRYTEHEYIGTNLDDLNPFTRTLIGCLTLGITELAKNHYWRCKECGKIQQNNL